ncbi:hypothetical protein IE53DRAFT_389254 [Violaceomyces palustris]|uniref:Uncharacterized protein n=1 Tax=Violaceomyces palustris TaxID=1673888 RepID=A0ACD0NRV3_9BASI|nr:hypothetical protein IE53DRAFT_389254 [Violaceomyces palustris]
MVSNRSASTRISPSPSPSLHHHLLLLLLLSLLANLRPASAQSSPLPSTNNAQSACVQLGDCTTLPAQNTYKTETQNVPVTPPAYTPGLATILNPASDSAYLSSLASAGGQAAFTSRKQTNGATQTNAVVLTTGSDGEVATLMTITTTASSSASQNTSEPLQIGFNSAQTLNIGTSIPLLSTSLVLITLSCLSGAFFIL